jgi:hypothetical protein
VDLAVGIAYVNVIVIDQRDMADATAGGRFCSPGTDATNSYDAEMRFL